MNILLTGATGFIGHHLYKYLSSKHEVFVLVRPSTQCKDFPSSHIFVFEDNIELLSIFIKENRIEGIIHLASLYLASHRSEQVKDLILSNVYLGTALLEATKKTNVSWFLNTGTIWQNYQSPAYSDTYNPVNLYAATKQAFLTVAKYYLETSSIRFCTLKLCDTYGPNDTRRKILSLFEENAISGQFLDMSPGEQKIDLIHVDDVVKGFEILMDILSNSQKDYRQEYVLTSGHQYSLRELAVMYEKKHHVKLNIHWGGRPYREREVMIPYLGNKLPGWEADETNHDINYK